MGFLYECLPTVCIEFAATVIWRRKFRFVLAKAYPSCSKCIRQISKDPLAYQRPYFGRSNGFMPFGGNFGANTGGTGASSQTVTTSDGQFGQVTSNGGTGDEAGSSEQTPSGTGGSAGGTSDGLSGAGENAPSSGGTNPSGMVAGGPGTQPP